MQHQLARIVTEVHIVQDNAAFQFAVGDRAVRFVRVLPRPDVGALFGFVHIAVCIFGCVDQFNITLIRFGRLVHQVKHTLCTGCRRDNKVDLLADLGDRVGKALIQATKVMTVPIVTPAKPLIASSAPTIATQA